MSTCPSNDIHSIYLDNELPDSYVAEYEAHVKMCENCAQKITAFRTLRDTFKTEAIAITPDNHYLEQSWERLQARKSYSKVTKHVYEFPAQRAKYIAVAAAAVLAVVIPVRMLRESNAMQSASINPISRKNTVALSKNNVIINGSIERAHVFAPDILQENQDVLPVHAAPTVMASVPFDDVDVFRPDFDSSGAITIKINIQGMVAPPLSENVSTGQFTGMLK